MPKITYLVYFDPCISNFEILNGKFRPKNLFLVQKLLNRLYFGQLISKLCKSVLGRVKIAMLGVRKINAFLQKSDSERSSLTPSKASVTHLLANKGTVFYCGGEFRSKDFKIYADLHEDIHTFLT